jgi:hypothetical protein
MKRWRHSLPEWEEQYSSDVKRVRRYLRSELGIAETPVRTEKVPTDLHDLVPLARQFGIGDDGTRGEAISMMPAEFTSSVRKVIEEREDAIRDWGIALDPCETTSALLALLEGFAPPVEYVPIEQWAPDDPRVAEMAEKIKWMLPPEPAPTKTRTAPTKKPSTKARTAPAKQSTATKARPAPQRPKASKKDQ